MGKITQQNINFAIRNQLIKRPRVVMNLKQLVITHIEG